MTDNPEAATPKRIQLRRTKGWRKPEGAIVVSRPSKWGNPFVVGTFKEGKIRYWCAAGWQGSRSWLPNIGAARTLTTEWYREWLEHDTLKPRCWHHSWIAKHVRIKAALKSGELRGHDLACWCPLEDAAGQRVPCHADVLLELANQAPKETL